MNGPPVILDKGYSSALDNVKSEGIENAFSVQSGYNGVSPKSIAASLNPRVTEELLQTCEIPMA